MRYVIGGWILLLAWSVGCSAPETPAPGEIVGLREVVAPDPGRLSEPQRAFYDTAITALGRLGDGDPAKPRAESYALLGKRMLSDGFADVAEPCFANAVFLDPARFEWIYYLAHVHAGKGNSDEAIAQFRRALELRPDDVACWVWLGNTLVGTANYDEARASFEKAIDLLPNAASAYLGLGRVALAEQRYEDAVTALTHTLELLPEATIAHYPLAQAYRGLGQTELARRHLERRGATEAYPFDPLMDEVRSRFRSPSAMTDRGGTAFSKGDFDAAISAFRKVIEQQPDVAMAHANLGAALFHAGDPDAARDAFETAMKLDPDDATVRYSLGVLDQHIGDRASAERRFEQALERDPEYVFAHVELAHLQRSSARLAASAAHYRAAIALEPRNAVAHLGLAMGLVREGRWRETRDVLEVAVEVLPDQPALALALARVLAAAPDDTVRDGAAAMRQLEVLIQAGRQDTDTGETLAMAMAELGRFDQAVAFQSQVIEVVRQAGRAELLPKMEERLAAYRASRAWREPWAADDPLHRAPAGALPAPPRRGGFES